MKPKSSFRVLVTGGSGFFGINFIRYALSRGWQVTSLDTEPFLYPEKLEIRTIQGDVRSGKDLNLALEGVDAVVHAAAALPLNSKNEIYSVEIEGTERVFETAISKGIRRFVHISSTAVYGVPKSHPISENSPLIGVGAYGKAKIKAEEVAASFRDQACVTIIRPKSFIGPERLGVFAILYDWASSGANFPIPGSGKNKYQYLDVEDLCEVVGKCLTASKEIASDTFNIGAEKFDTFKSDFQFVLDLAGHGKKVVSLPALPAIWILRLLDKIGLSPLYPWVYETAVTDSYVSIKKAKSILGFSPRYSNKEALERNYRWYMANKDSFQGSTGKTHRVPWKQGALRLVKILMKL